MGGLAAMTSASPEHKAADGTQQARNLLMDLGERARGGSGS
jgi:hypothetical protein